MKDFDTARRKREQADRTFKIAGSEFRFRAAVAPEAILGWSQMTAGADVSEAEWLTIIDETITAMLEPEFAKEWERIRDPELAHPLNLSDLQDVLQWLIEQVVGRPTGPPSDSSTSDGDTGTQLTVVSSSPAEPALTAST